MTRVFFFILACVLALPGYTQTRYEKLTSKYRLSHCEERVETIRDRMRPGMREIFATAPKIPVHVTKKLELNAHADGYAIIFSPTICEALPDDDQFSIIVGHEIAHNLLGHYAEALTGQIIGSSAESVFTSLTGIPLFGVGSTIGVIAFSKDREREADYHGLYLAAYSGYDISGAADLWRTFTLKTGGGSGGWTHPSHPERSARAMLVVVDVAHKKRDKRALVPDEPPVLYDSTIKASPRRD